MHAKTLDLAKCKYNIFCVFSGHNNNKRSWAEKAFFRVNVSLNVSTYMNNMTKMQHYKDSKTHIVSVSTRAFWKFQK